MSDHRPAYWKMILTIAPILGASLIAASLTIDEYHNCKLRERPSRKRECVANGDHLMTGYDCVGGALTGTFCAIVSAGCIFGTSPA